MLRCGPKPPPALSPSLPGGLRLGDVCVGIATKRNKGFLLLAGSRGVSAAERESLNSIKYYYIVKFLKEFDKLSDGIKSGNLQAIAFFQCDFRGVYITFLISVFALEVFFSVT